MNWSIIIGIAAIGDAAASLLCPRFLLSKKREKAMVARGKNPGNFRIWMSASTLLLGFVFIAVGICERHLPNLIVRWNYIELGAIIVFAISVVCIHKIYTGKFAELSTEETE